MFAIIGWSKDPANWKILNLNPEEEQDWINLCSTLINPEERKVYLHTMTREQELFNFIDNLQ